MSAFIVPETLHLGSSGPDIRRAAALLAGGGLVAFPTETVYGLGADARSPAAVAALYAAKQRPRFNPLITHVFDAAAARREGRLDGRAERLIEAFWPGPLTLVVPVGGTTQTCELARAGLDSLALRNPSHPVALDLLKEAGIPVVAPSANRSGRVSPTRAAHVREDLDGRIDAVVDGGASPVGVESTIVACLEGRAAALLRAGGVSRQALETVLGERLQRQGLPENGHTPLAPGMLTSHYAPRARVRLGALSVEPGEAVLRFGPQPPAGLEQAAGSLNLSAGGDVVEAAANLFAALRQLDATSAPVIAVMPIPEEGVGEAINDRLTRAAAERTGGVD